MSLDYAAWVQRAKSFLRNLSRMPGPITIYDMIESPVTDNKDWLKSPTCSLPMNIRRFLSTGSKRCAFQYHWRPRGAARDRLQELLPGADELCGAVDLCQAAAYSVYDSRDWHNAFQEETLTSALELLPEEVRDGLDVRPLLGERIRDRGDRLELSPFYVGDKLEMELRPNGQTGKVYRTPKTTEGAPSVFIADDFDAFLLAWESICYVTPTEANFQPWLDADGRLAPHAERARRLRSLLMNPAV